MVKVLSILPLKRFEDCGVVFPDALDMHFVHALSEDGVVAACKGMDFLFVPAAFPPITTRVLENIPTIRMIQSAGVGYDKVDAESAARLGIPVANSPGHNNSTVAEYTIALLIAFQRHIAVCDREIKSGKYAPVRERFWREGIREVRGTTLGILGMGAIGREVVGLANVLGATVSYYDVKRVSAETETALRISFKTFEEIVATSDVISLHVPLNDRTRSLIGQRELEIMRAGAFLINTSRGETVDQEALAAALEKGRIGGAAIDTVSPEPPPPDHPLLNLSKEAGDRLLITPHIAGITKGAFNRMLSAGLANIVNVAQGGRPDHVVNGVLEARKTAPVKEKPPDL